MSGEAQLTARFSDQPSLEAFARRFASLISAGDLIALSGDLGAGKTTFTRAVIRSLADHPIEVPSPTFTILQIYDEISPPLVHADLYRLQSEDELDELGLDDYLKDCALFIEWPEIGMGRFPTDPLVRLSLEIEQSEGVDARKMTASGGTNWTSRFRHLEYWR